MAFFTGGKDLLTAAEQADLERVQLLLVGGADVRATNAAGETALHKIAAAGPRVFRTVTLAFGQDDVTQTEDTSESDPAAADRAAEIARLLLDHGADIEHRTARGWTPLFTAIDQGRTTVCRVLLERGARVDGRDAEGWYPIAKAVSRGMTDIVRSLVEHGADVNVVLGRPPAVQTGMARFGMNTEGRSILAFALEAGMIDAARLLIEHGHRVNEPDGEGWLPLQSAALYGVDEVIDALLDHGADANGRGYKGRTALHEAAREGRVAIAERLIAAGADVNAQDQDGRSPVFNADSEGHEACAEFLLEHGASPRLTDKRDYTLLHLAALHGRIRIVQKLLELGADPNAESTSEFTPLDGAREGGHPEIAELLRARGASRSRNSEGGTGDWIAKGDAAAERGDLDAAIECFDRALAQNPRAVRAFIHKGNALSHHGRHEDAIQWYDRAIAVDPGYSEGIAWGQKGCALQDLRRLDEAVACYQAVLKINAVDATACFNIGVVRHNQGRNDDAVRWYRAALEHDPSHGQARAYLAEILGDRDRDTT